MFITPGFINFPLTGLFPAIFLENISRRTEKSTLPTRWWQRAKMVTGPQFSG
ncbi:hypothetical protein [Neomoorella glycerini]|uniref:hypothetical protein n=1 Tax=Neomoorella glycerini TaxID=55779 RepID=UPI001B8D3DC9|nr:hypothetical protein [Moorella glycerini]